MEELTEPTEDVYEMTESANQGICSSPILSNGCIKDDYQMLIENSNKAKAKEMYHTPYYNEGFVNIESESEENKETVMDVNGTETSELTSSHSGASRWRRNMQCVIIMFCFLLIIAFFVVPVVLSLKHPFASGEGSEYSLHMSQPH